MRCGLGRYSAVFHDANAWDASAAWYAAEVAEYERNGDGSPWSETPHYERCDSQASTKDSGNTACETVGDIVKASRASLGALLDKYRVDIYAAGHVHSYSTTWPIFGGTVAKKSLVDPYGTVHVLEGNGGVPGTGVHNGRKRASHIVNCTRSAPQEPRSPIDVFRICGTGMNYGRLIATNASVLTYEHVDNANGRITDRWSIIKTQPASMQDSTS